MKMSYRSININSEYDPPILELPEGEINQVRGKDRRQNWKYSYPQHLSPLQTSSHRHYGAISFSNRPLPTICHLSSSAKGTNKTVDSAFSILQYQLNDEQARQAHLENIRQNLERRLQAAIASGNEHLVDLLKKESKQLEMNV